ncbi:MFS domain-containing protein [Schizosaccharomyces pombe]|uniref:Uncharacterized transporter C417.10 n=1 Tax=Schizosaccharomyces pombe (strain 972 / ATCC 24843) TaxID=284812 RepID=YC7A_SCHPO|nr:putative dipeptide transmembrane transporter [Schizosaccharomyces pombe]O94491.1 RecName: Full=Uncharacterized transporter C417.10 [Schizosaccharomyces pombe 972h-]CAA22656.1 dipeptide transmembrane transporter (predicted) [Schizosaccharomyces pombe]|eukprot:NP_588287.1 putative dipeptide transmembrane transporter [Schizosaccharomyces pombe]
MSSISIDEKLKDPESVQNKEILDVDVGDLSPKGVDAAFNYALDVDYDEIDPETERRLVRKIDCTIFPVMCLVYCIQFLDKTSNSYAVIMGLKEDLKMEGQMYSWSGTAFYLGYLVFEFPASLLLQRFPLSKTLCVFLVIWGFLLCMTSVANYPGFIALRVLLGMMESAASPGFILLTAQWYKRSEQQLRTSVWVAFNGLGQILGSCMAYGLAKRTSLPMRGWKLIFIICGVLAIFLGFVILAVVPDNPFKAWFLTEEDRKLVVKRLRANKQGVGNNHFKLYQFKETMLDIRTWIMFVSSVLLNIPNGGIGTFSSLLIKGTMGYDTLQTLLMGLPAGACEFGGLIAFGFLSLFIHKRMVLATITTCIALIGSCLLSFAGPPRAQLAGYYLLMVSPGAMIVMFAIISSNASGYTKKVTVGVIYLIGYCVGNLIGPQTFKAADAPEYMPAKNTMVGCYAATLVTFPALYYVNWRENKRRDQLAAEGKIEHRPNAEFEDLTDFENLDFRYTL